MEGKVGKFIDFAPRKVNQNNNPPSASKSEKPRNANGAYLIVIIVLTIVFICSLNSLFSTTPATSDSFKPALSSPSVNGESTNSENDINSSPESSTQDNNSNFTNSAEYPQTETNNTKSNLSIEILNGSGISNTASDVKTYLEQKEYKIANIGTANNLYPSTVIYFKKGNDNLANELAKDLNQYETSVLENSELVGEYDILIVVGQK